MTSRGRRNMVNRSNFNQQRPNMRVGEDDGSRSKAKMEEGYYEYDGPNSKRRRVEPENHVLLMTILNPVYPVTTDVIHTISSPYGKVLRIVIFKKNGVQAMVEFASIEEAKRAKDALHGADIYSGCCTVRIEFAKPTKLNVYKNDLDSWDYTNPNLGGQLRKTPHGQRFSELRLHDWPSHPPKTEIEGAVLSVGPTERHLFGAFPGLVKQDHSEKRPLLEEPRYGSGPTPYKPSMSGMRSMTSGSLFSEQFEYGPRGAGPTSFANFSPEPFEGRRYSIFFNTPPGINEEELKKVFEDSGAKPPTGIKLFPSKCK